MATHGEHGGATTTTGRPCAQCQSRHVSCDRQRPCRRCVEAGPGLASACCDPPAAPKKRGRPPGSKRKTNQQPQTTAPTVQPPHAQPAVPVPLPQHAQPLRPHPIGPMFIPPIPIADPFVANAPNALATRAGPPSAMTTTTTATMATMATLPSMPIAVAAAGLPRRTSGSPVQSSGSSPSMSSPPASSSPGLAALAQVSESTRPVSITWFGGESGTAPCPSTSPSATTDASGSPAKRPRLEPWCSTPSPPVAPSPTPILSVRVDEYYAAAQANPTESSPSDDQTGTYESPLNQRQAPQPTTDSSDFGSESETVVLMRSILTELRGLRSDYAAMVSRQSAMEERLNALTTSVDNHRKAFMQQEPALASRTITSSPSAVIFPRTPTGERPIAASWEDVVAAFNRAAEVVASSSSSASLFPRSPYSITWTSPLPIGRHMREFDGPLQMCDASYAATLSYSSTVSIPYSPIVPASPPLPSNVSLHSFDITRPRILAVLPNTHLSSSLDRPWLMERTITIDPEKEPARHRLPSPDLLPFFGNKRTVVTAVNEPFQRLARFSSIEEMHELNTMWFYPPLVREKLAILYRDWLSKQAPAFLSPVFLATCPMMTRDGLVLHTLSRTQLYYNEEGEYAWCMTVLDYWSTVDSSEGQGEVESDTDRFSVEEELEALLRGFQSP